MPIFELFDREPREGNPYSYYDVRNPIQIRAPDSEKARETLFRFMDCRFYGGAPWLNNESADCSLLSDMGEGVSDESVEILSPSDLRKMWLDHLGSAT